MCRHVLLELRRTRWRLMAVERNDYQVAEIQSAHDREQLEAMHDQHKQKILPALTAFSEVQQEILQAEFIK